MTFISANRKCLVMMIACGTALLLAAAVAVVVALRNRRQPAPPPDVPVAASSSEVRVKAVERKCRNRCISQQNYVIGGGNVV
jgi:hypothetical protein